MSDESKLEVYPSNSDREGGCSACNRYVHSRGMHHHRTWVIRFAGLQARVCVECRKELLKQLGRPG